MAGAGVPGREIRALCRKGQLFTTFPPAIGPDALKAKGQQVREWRIHERAGSDLADLATWINPVVRGWMNYLIDREPGPFAHWAWISTF
jgi:hypothetical protein